ncbi:MAG: hypothetical protein WC156_05580, partial [Pedobacter sp.]
NSGVTILNDAVILTINGSSYETLLEVRLQHSSFLIIFHNCSHFNWGNESALFHSAGKTLGVPCMSPLRGFIIIIFPNRGSYPGL